MIKVYRYCYCGHTEEVRDCPDMHSVNCFIGAEAGRLNYGLCRKWSDKDFTYFDCGPVTYCIKNK